MTKDITKHITVAETFFTEWRTAWRSFDLLPFVHFDRERVLIGWLCFTIDIHSQNYEED